MSDELSNAVDVDAALNKLRFAVYDDRLDRYACADFIEAEITRLTERNTALEVLAEVANLLVVTLDAVHADPSFMSVYTIAAVHGAQYTGRTYENELEALRATLAALGVPN